MILKFKKKSSAQKSNISIKNADTDKIVVSNQVPFGKKGFKSFLGDKDAKEIGFNVYFHQK